MKRNQFKKLYRILRLVRRGAEIRTGADSLWQAVTEDWWIFADGDFGSCQF